MDMREPLITTIIPTYRRPRLLRRAIASVLNQTYTNLRIRVYDNASNDETEDTVGKFSEKDPRVEYYRHPENIGASENFIQGIERVDTPFFSILSDDDVILPRFYERAMDGFNKHPDAMFFSGITICVKGDRIMAPLVLWDKEGYYAPPYGFLKMVNGNCPIWTSVLFRREVIDRIGNLDIGAGDYIDFDYEFRIAARFPIIASNEPCALFTIHPMSFTGMDGHQYDWRGWIKTMDNIVRDENIAPEIRDQAERIFRKYIFRMGVGSILKNDRENAYYILDALRKLGYRKECLLLYTILGINGKFSFLPFSRSLIALAESGRSKSLEKTYGEYLQYIDI